MVGKFLLTVIVILLAFIVLRQRHRAEKKARGGQTQKGLKDFTAGNEADNFSKDVRLAAYLFLVLMIGIAAALYYTRWQDDHTVVTVTLYRDGQQEPVTYRVYRYQLGERSFTTLDGISVTVAASERMEIDGLDE